MSYDFSQLNDKEFEILSVDLLSIVFGKRIERFKPGKDAGVDGRFFADTNKEIILQSKHYLKSGYKKLISSIEKEIIKIRKLKPDKYIFVTSLPLSRNNKKEIKKICCPFIKRDDDIFGQEDLNDLISGNPKIEEKHFKLWICSTTVFNRILNNAIKGRSEFEIEQIREKAFKYVQTRSHNDALKILDKTNVLIISGEPGIGKTTLAQNLCLQYVTKDYEFFDIEESLSEAESVYKRGEKQIFSFDDFLGSNYFEAIENKKDSHIVKFMERVKNDETKKFVLTSRTNILNSGILYSTIFTNKKIRKNEFLLTIEKISNLGKAKILYNHIWHSKLNEEFIGELYKEKRYRDIIKHKNFNPRLIEFITDVDGLTVQASEYWAYILKTLKNPRDIWNNCFKYQSNAFVRNLVILTVFNGGRIPEKDLRRSFYEIMDIEELKNGSNTEKDFESVAQLATKSFLNKNRTLNTESYYSLFNPSITDFILNEYSKNTDKVIDTYKSLYSVKSLKTLLNLTIEEIIPSDASAKILDELFTDAFKKEKSYDYLIYISCLFINNADKKKKKNIIQLLSKIITSSLPINEFSSFLKLLSEYEQDLNIVNFDFLLDIFKDRYLEYDEIEDFTEFLRIHRIENPKLFDELKKQIENYLYDTLDDVADSIALSDYIDYEEQYGGGSDMNVHEDSILENIKDSLLSSISGLDPNLLDKLDLDISYIANQVDIEGMVSDYFESMRDEAYDSTCGGDFKDLDNDIDDLFERS